MSEENITQVDDKCCLDDAKPMEIVETMSVIKEEIEGSDVLLLLPVAVSNEINHVNPRRYSTGSIDKRGLSKAQVETRYRGNQLSSTHDLCKHGKRREEDLVIKPWKLVKNKNVEVEGGDLVKGESLSVMRKSLGNVSKLKKQSQVPKRDSTNEIVKSCDGLRVKTSETRSGSAVVREVKKTNIDVKKVSRINENKSSKEDIVKNLKNKEKMKIEEDVLEKTLYVVESSIEEKTKKKSIKNVKPEIQQSSEKKILRGTGKTSLKPLPSLSPSSKEVKGSKVTRSDPKPIRQTTSKSKSGLPEKKEIGSANLVTNSITESKIRPKRIGLKVTPPTSTTTKQVSFKKGKVLELKPEDSAPKLIKFKKRVVQEPKLRSYGTKKSLKDKREVIGKMSYNNSEGKREKVVLRHRKVEEKKKLQTLFNNVIEETVNKLEDVRKSKVKALVGAFETVISLQDNDITSQKKKTQRKSTSAEVMDG